MSGNGAAPKPGEITMSKSSVRSSKSSKSVAFEMMQYELSQHEEAAEEHEEMIDNRDWTEIIADANGGNNVFPVYFWSEDYNYVGNVVEWTHAGICYVDGMGMKHAVPLRDCYVKYTHVIIAPDDVRRDNADALRRLTEWHSAGFVPEGWNWFHA